jgi:tetratricopeptide (TPR) repeat protein
MTRPYRLRLACQLICVAVFLCSVHSSGQEPAATASLRGTIRDWQGKLVSQAKVILQRSGSRDNFQMQTDEQGNYVFPKLPDGVYTVRATKDGYADALIRSVFLKPSESKDIDLTLGAEPPSPSSLSSAPQLFDQPQFSVAGVTDATSLGGHGSDVVVSTRDSLAKDTISLTAGVVRVPPNALDEGPLREAVEQQPADFGANHRLGQFLLARGQAREAIPFLKRAAATQPDNYENVYDLALANVQAGNDTAARAEIVKLLATHDQADLHHLLADVDEKLGDSLEAVWHFQRSAELDPTESHLFDWGAELLLHHAPEPAAEVFAKGNRLFPSSARMLLALGAAYFARGAYDEAVLEISQASDLNPKDPMPYQFLGKIEQAEKIPSTELVEKLHRFLTLEPHSSDANYYYALGLWRLRNTAPAKASITQVESLLKTALQIDPGQAAAALQLGIVHSDQGAYSEAIADYRKALEADPQLEEAHYRLAQAYRQVGETDKAKEELRVYTQLAKESAREQDRERHEIKQFVYTLRHQSSAKIP